MEDEELEELRRKKLLELQQQQLYAQQQAAEEEQQRQQFEEQKKHVLRQIMTPDARERLTRIKISRPEIGETIENQLIILAQQGQLKEKITDEQLRGLLQKLLPKKRDITIKRKGL